MTHRLSLRSPASKVGVDFHFNFAADHQAGPERSTTEDGREIDATVMIPWSQDATLQCFEQVAGFSPVWPVRRKMHQLRMAAVRIQ